MFLEICQLLAESQYGFHSNRSSTLALESKEGITKAVDNKEHAMGLFTDF